MMFKINNSHFNRNPASYHLAIEYQQQQQQQKHDYFDYPMNTLTCMPTTQNIINQAKPPTTSADGGETIKVILTNPSSSSSSSSSASSTSSASLSSKASNRFHHQQQYRQQQQQDSVDIESIPPPNKRFASPTQLIRHQQAQAEQMYRKFKQQQQQQQQRDDLKKQQQAAQTEAVAAAPTFDSTATVIQQTMTALQHSTVPTSDLMNNLLLRTLTEVLNNQLMLTRKVDLISENIDCMYKRLTDIEGALSHNKCSNHEDTLSVCNSDHQHRSRAHHVDTNNNDVVDDNDDDDNNSNDMDMRHQSMSPPPPQGGSAIPQQVFHSSLLQQQHRQLMESPHSNDHFHHHLYSTPTGIPSTNSAFVQHYTNSGSSTNSNNGHHYDIDSLLHLDKDAETIVQRDIIKRCLRKAKHRGNFAANLAAELFSKEERITCNCTGTRGKKQLSPRRLQLVKNITFQLFQCEPGADVDEVWRKECITAIDAKNRSIGRDTTNSIKSLAAYDAAPSSSSTPPLTQPLQQQQQQQHDNSSDN